MDKENQNTKKGYLNKLPKLFKNILIIIILAIGGYVILLAKSTGTNLGEELEAKTKFNSMVKDTAVVKSYTISKTVSTMIINRLDSVLPNVHDTAIVEMFGNSYCTYKMGRKHFCVMYEDRDVIVLEKLNETMLYAMSMRHYHQYVDPINEVYED